MSDLKYETRDMRREMQSGNLPEIKKRLTISGTTSFTFWVLTDQKITVSHAPYRNAFWYLL